MPIPHTTQPAVDPERCAVLDARCSRSSVAGLMDYDTDKVDETVLALLFLTLHDDNRAWKGFDWGTLDRLHEKGLIRDPKNKTKSVVLTSLGLAESERLFDKLFGGGGKKNRSKR